MKVLSSHSNCNVFAIELNTKNKDVFRLKILIQLAICEIGQRFKLNVDESTQQMDVPLFPSKLFSFINSGKKG